MKLLEMFPAQDRPDENVEIDWMDDLKFYIDNDHHLLSTFIFPAIEKHKQNPEDNNAYKLYVKPLVRCCEHYCQKYDIKDPNKKFKNSDIINLAKAVSEEQRKHIVDGDYDTGIEKLSLFKKKIKKNSGKKQGVAEGRDDEDEVDKITLIKSLQWPELVNKVNSAMKSMGWKGQRKDDGSFMFSTQGQLDDEWYIVVIDNRGNKMFTYALGTVEEGDPHIGEQESLPMTEASVSELMNAIREGFGLSEASVSEVSKATIDRYVTKASDAHGAADFAARMSKNDPDKRRYHVDQKNTAEKRRQGISRALDRMSKDGVAEAAGVGIVTKQNATVDVPVGGEYMNVKKLFPKKKKSSVAESDSNNQLLKKQQQIVKTQKIIDQYENHLDDLKRQLNSIQDKLKRSINSLFPEIAPSSIYREISEIYKNLKIDNYNMYIKDIDLAEQNLKNSLLELTEPLRERIMNVESQQSYYDEKLWKLKND